MEKDILTAIVEVEKEIRERLAAERSSAEARLEQLRRDGEEEVSREEERLKIELHNRLAAAKAEVEKRAAVLVGDASAQAEKLAGLDEETLRRHIMRHLTRIAPGKQHDSRDVEG